MRCEKVGASLSSPRNTRAVAPRRRTARARKPNDALLKQQLTASIFTSQTVIHIKNSNASLWNAQGGEQR